MAGDRERQPAPEHEPGADQADQGNDDPDRLRQSIPSQPVTGEAIKAIAEAPEHLEIEVPKERACGPGRQRLGTRLRARNGADDRNGPSQLQPVLVDTHAGMLRATPLRKGVRTPDRATLVIRSNGAPPTLDPAAPSGPRRKAALSRARLPRLPRLPAWTRFCLDCCRTRQPAMLMAGILTWENCTGII